MKIILVQNAKIQHSKRRGHKRQRICSYLDFKELQHFGIHHTKRKKKTQYVWSTLSLPPHLELSLRELNGKQCYLIVSKADYLWLGISYFRPSNTSLRRVRSVTPSHSVNGVLLISLSVQTHWRKVKSVRLFCCRNCSGARSALLLAQRPHVQGIQTQGHVSHGSLVHPVFSAFRHHLLLSECVIVCL